MSNLRKINQLKEMLKSDDFDIHSFDSELSSIIAAIGDDIPLELFTLFKNYPGDDKYERAMWTLLHGIESLRGNAYTQKIVPGLKLVAKNGSEWAELIAIRNLNSEEYRGLLAVSLKTATQEDRAIWKSTIQSLISNEPDFENKAKSVLSSLN